MNEGWPAGITVPTLLFSGAAFLLVFSVVALLAILVRRQRRREMRDLVGAVEELRSGRLGRALEVDPRSPNVLLADAINRLAQDLAMRWTQFEGAAEELTGVLDAARDYAVIVTDGDGDIRRFSSGATALFGWDEESARGRNVSILFDEGAWKDFLPKLARRGLRERGIETRGLLMRRDGTSFHGRVFVRPLGGSSGDAQGFLAIAQDVTPEVRLEAELREAERRYRRLVEGMSEGVALLQGGTVVYGNPALAALLDVPLDALVGVVLHERVTTPEVFLLRSRLERLAAAPEGSVDTFSVGLAAERGAARRRVRISATAVTHEGAPAALLTFFDETAQRRAQAELEENEARLDAVLESASDGLLLLEDTPAGAVVRMTNDAFVSILGLRRDEVLGATEGEMLRLLRSLGGGAEAIAALLAGATSEPRRETITLYAERPRILDLSVVPLPAETREGGGRVLACRDVTGQKTFEGELTAAAERLRSSKGELEASYRELRRVHDDLAKQNADVDRLNRELRTLDSMKSELLANVSHELQTPLVAIRGYTEMILKGRLGGVNEEQRRGLALSLRNIDRLIAMIDNLLAFARSERETGPIRITAFPLASVVREALDLLGEKLGGKSIQVETEFEDPDLAIRGDRDKILQVFINLLSNAVKFNRDGGKIAVSVRHGKPGFALVQVSDTGVGIGPDELDRIFERHYQAGSAAERAREGAGLGLAIVRNILRLHGCVIQAKSRLGEGTSFSFTLPLAGDAAGGGPGPVGPPPPSSLPPSEPDSPPSEPPASDGGPRAEAPAGPRLRIIRRASGR